MKITQHAKLINITKKMLARAGVILTVGLSLVYPTELDLEQGLYGQIQIMTKQMNGVVKTL